ncbi:MAG: hypothetical protein H6737_17830 [Alphaproteobacteria bacterium]|nr:hypothetical protein [Alphaproteobacteria bacterium]
MLAFAAVSVVSLLAGCGGAPDWLEGVELSGLDVDDRGNSLVVRGVPYGRVASRLEDAGWRGWSASYDEGLPAGFAYRWSKGGRWVDVGALEVSKPDHWTVRKGVEPPARPIPMEPVRPGAVITAGWSEALAAASMCTNEEGTSLHVRLDGTFSMGGTIGGAPAKVDGRWSLKGADLVLNGAMAGEGREKPYTTTCEDLVVLGREHVAQVVHCRNGGTWSCSVAPGPLVTVLDAGAGEGAANHVLRALRRDDRPDDPGPHLDGIPTQSLVYRAGATRERPAGVRVRYREDRDQAERYAYRLARDLELDDAFVEAWPEAPTPFVVEVGGQVRIGGGPPPEPPPPVPEIEGYRPELPDAPAIFAFVPGATGCDWVVAGAGEPVRVASSPACPDELAVSGKTAVARFGDVLVKRRWPGTAWSQEIQPAREQGCELPVPDADGRLRQVCLEPAPDGWTDGGRPLPVATDAGGARYAVAGGQVVAPRGDAADIDLGTGGTPGFAVVWAREPSGSWKRVLALPTRLDGPVELGARVADAHRGAAPDLLDLAARPGCTECAGIPVELVEGAQLATLGKAVGVEGDGLGTVGLAKGALVVGFGEEVRGPVHWCPSLAPFRRPVAWAVPEGALAFWEHDRHVLIGAPGSGAAARVFRPPDAAPIVDLPRSVRAVWLPTRGLPGF